MHKTTFLALTALFCLSAFPGAATAGEIAVLINNEACKINAPDKTTKPNMKDSEDIHYTQATISRKFMEGTPVDDVPKENVKEFPPIRIFDPFLSGGACNETYSLDNRRLWVAKKYGVKIRTVVATATEILDALEDREGFNLIWPDSQTFENCDDDEIYFDKEEAKENCIE